MTVHIQFMDRDDYIALQQQPLDDMDDAQDDVETLTAEIHRLEHEIAAMTRDLEGQD
jgi:hypothetical protein